MKSDKIDHIGVAVKSIDERLNFYRDLLGFEVVKTEELPDRGLKVAFVKVGDTRIELLEPLGEGSQISKFLEKKGEGIHHMAFHVDDVALGIKDAVEKGFKPLSAEPQQGAGGTKVVFLHPKTTGGVLVELVQGEH